MQERREERVTSGRRTRRRADGHASNFTLSNTRGLETATVHRAADGAFIEVRPFPAAADPDASSTGFSSQIRTKLRDWAVWPVRAGCHFWAAMSSNDSKTL